MTEERGLNHLDRAGAARMVDVSAKEVTTRTATAAGRVLVCAEVVALLRGGGVPKGDAIAVARIAGIQAAKRTPDLIPLCHPIALHGIDVDIQVEDDHVAITATIRTADRTGVEMEALTAVAVAGQVTVGGITWGSLRSAHIGYWIDRQLAGQGIVPTAVALATDHLFDVGLHRVEINIRPENAASLRVVEKLGFRPEGSRLRFLHIDGAWRDHQCFALTAEEVGGSILSRWNQSRPGSLSGPETASGGGAFG